MSAVLRAESYLTRVCFCLREQAQLRRLERVFLRHRVFRAVQRIQNELPEKRKSNRPYKLQMLLAFVIYEEQMIARFLRPDVHIFA